MRRVRLPLLALVAGAAACGDDPAGNEGQPAQTCAVSLEPSADDQANVQTAFLKAAAGSMICFADGTYRFTDELSLTVPGITLRGVGDAVVFDFAGQEAGGIGLDVTGDDFTIENVAIRNAADGGIRVSDADGVTFRELRVSWDAGSVPANGAWAIHALGCTNVLVEDSAVSGASAAGILVGQSSNVVVRRNTVQGNVAGIEIENSSDVEIYENQASDNAGGILVFNLPRLPAGMGARVLIRDNVIEGNNRTNFTMTPSLSILPTGTGVMLLAADRTEIRGNAIEENQSAGVLVASYQTAEAVGGVAADDPTYDKYASETWVRGNRFAGNGSAPKGLLATFDPGADVVWDAFEAAPVTALCIQNEGASFRNLAFGESGDLGIGDLDCAREPLPPVSF